MVQLLMKNVTLFRVKYVVATVHKFEGPFIERCPIVHRVIDYVNYVKEEEICSKALVTYIIRKLDISSKYQRVLWLFVIDN